MINQLMLDRNGQYYYLTQMYMYTAHVPSCQILIVVIEFTSIIIIDIVKEVNTHIHTRAHTHTHTHTHLHALTRSTCVRMVQTQLLAPINHYLGH